MHIMKSAALVLPALLLAGCSLADVKTAVMPVENTATIETAPTAAPQTLTVYASDALAPAARAYAEAQGVTLTMTADAAAADLLLTDHAPGGSLLDVRSDTLLAAAAARADITGNASTLPLGRSLYGYWANGAVLNALLGDGALTALQGADWEEWSDFVETLRLAGRAEGRNRHAERQRLHPARGTPRRRDGYRRLCGPGGPGVRLHGRAAGC